MPVSVGFARAGANILRAVISGSSIKEAVAQELARAGGEEDAAAHTALVAVLASVDAGTSYAAAAPVYVRVPPSVAIGGKRLGARWHRLVITHYPTPSSTTHPALSQWGYTPLPPPPPTCLRISLVSVGMVGHLVTH